MWVSFFIPTFPGFSRRAPGQTNLRKSAKFFGARTSPTSHEPPLSLQTWDTSLQTSPVRVPLHQGFPEGASGRANLSGHARLARLTSSRGNKTVGGNTKIHESCQAETLRSKFPIENPPLLTPRQVRRCPRRNWGLRTSSLLQGPGSRGHSQDRNVGASGRIPPFWKLELGICPFLRCCNERKPLWIGAKGCEHMCSLADSCAARPWPP